MEELNRRGVFSGPGLTPLNNPTKTTTIVTEHSSSANSISESYAKVLNYFKNILSVTISVIWKVCIAILLITNWLIVTKIVIRV
jgi:hypothetical protein